MYSIAKEVNNPRMVTHLSVFDLFDVTAGQMILQLDT